MTSQQIVDMLNDAVRRDRRAMQALLAAKADCNGALAEHPHIPVDIDEWERTVCVTAILEGIFDLDGDSVEVEWDVHGNPEDLDFTLIGFSLRPKR